jgi:hypothetical protein
MDDSALTYPVIAWILVEGRGEYSIRENSHAGRAQHGCAELLAQSAGIMAVLRICIEKLCIAGGVEGGKQRNGPGNLREGKHHFGRGGELLWGLFGLDHLRICASAERRKLPSDEPPTKMAAIAMHRAMLLPDLSRAVLPALAPLGQTRGPSVPRRE